jgi:hypothetical protein
MEPVNKSMQAGCVPTSSNCVIWQGPDIPCINICKGDSISDITFKVADELCSLLTMFDLSNYDLSCLTAECPKPEDFSDLIQLIIEKLCEVNTVVVNIPPGGLGELPQDDPVLTPRPGVSSDCPTCTVSIAPCFQYMSNGVLVDTMDISEYALAIGAKVCGLVQQGSSMQSSLDSHEKRISTLEGASTLVPELPLVTSQCLMPGQVGVAPLVEAIEDKLCKLQTVLGDENQIFVAISKQCVGLDTELALATNANMGSLAGWTQQSVFRNASHAMGNMYIMLCDLRAAVRSIQETCCTTGCSQVSITMTASLDAIAQTLTLYLIGSIPSSFQDCGGGTGSGSLLVVTDGYGNVYQTFVPLKANINGTVAISLAGKGLNLATDLVVSLKSCLFDQATQTQCMDCHDYTVRNTTMCPSLLTIPTTTSIYWSFTNVVANTSYTISLMTIDSVPITSVTQSNIPVGPVSGTFYSPDVAPGTPYIMQVSVTINGVTTTCPQNVVTTVSTPCIAPGSVSADGTL